MAVALRDVDVPSFGVPLAPRPFPPPRTSSAAARPIRRAGCDWLVVYADREHLANIAFLSGYDPRFEEALLLLGPQDRRILVVGNEGEDYAPLAGLPGLEMALAQSLSLMGQDRSRKPDLAGRVERCRSAQRVRRIGLVGWKYFEPAEWDEPSSGPFVPHYLVAMLGKIAGGADAVDGRDIRAHASRRRACVRRSTPTRSRCTNGARRALPPPCGGS